jgi:hypothetical protein
MKMLAKAGGKHANNKQREGIASERCYDPKPDMLYAGD